MKGESSKPLRSLPAVDTVLNTATARTLIARHGRTPVVAAIRKIIEATRAGLRQGGASAGAGDAESVAAKAGQWLESENQPILRRSINATGIVLHTGLGRAVMPESARQALLAASGFCNVQLDLGTNDRITREECIRGLVRELTGAEDVALVNNNAGATLLVLRALAQGREVVISRGELIEIGGAFRLPDVMKEGGAILKEVGTTNKTHARDYETAITPNTALLMKAHKSNYSIVGFAKEVGIQEIAAIGKKHKIPVVDDLGCGALVPLEQYGLPHEVTVQESLAAGADLALFSTDKLIGGPQGGLIAGRKDLIAAIRKCPLYRALRVCKLTLASLEATLRLFKAPELLAELHPIYTMMAKPVDELERLATQLSADLGRKRPDWQLSVIPTVCYLGGGSLPGAELKSFAVRVVSKTLSAEEMAAGFRAGRVPVLPRVHDGAVLLDLRTVAAAEITELLDVASAIGGGSGK